MNPDPINELRSMRDELYQQAYTGWQNFLREAVTDMEVHLGAQFTAEEQAWAEANDRILYPFGKSARQVELLYGYEIRNRHMLKIGPIGRSDDAACRQHTALLHWQMSAFNGYEELSRCFKWGSLVTGSNLFEFWRDREGQLRFGRRSFNTFLLDPGLSHADLSDCGYVIMGRWLDRDRVKGLLPEQADKIDNIPGISASARWSLSPQMLHSDRKDNMLFEELYRPTQEFEPYVVSRMTGTDTSVESLVAEARKSGLDERGVNYWIDNARLPNGIPMFSRFQKPITVIQLTLYVNNETVFDGPQPLKIDEYPFVWLHGEWMPECDRDELKLQSFTRGLRPTTRARNRRINQILDIIERQIQNVRLYREGSLVDKEDAYRSGQTHPIAIKAEAQGSLLDHFAQLPAPEIPSGLFTICELLEREETQVKGLNEEIFGSDDKDNVPGILAKFRTGQALTGQQGIFDSYREAKRQVGRKAVKLNQALMDERRVARIIEEIPDPAFYAPDFAKYDCTPIEAQLSETQQQDAFRQLVELCTVFPKIAELVPPSMIVGMAPISFKPDFMQVLQGNEKQAQQMAMLAMRNQEIMNRLIESQTQVGIAKSKAEQAGTVLDNAKALTELAALAQQPRLDRMDRGIKLLDILQRAQQAQQTQQSRVTE